MSRSIFKVLLAIVALCVTTPVLLAQTKPVGLDRRQHEGYSGWKRLVPTHIKGQYAGGVGVASVGFGWDYGKKCRWETDLMVGYLPECYSDQDRFVFALKQHYIPWQLRLSDRLSIDPLTCGLYATVISGDGFWFQEPEDRYGGSYYRFPTRARAYIYVGQRATWHIRRSSSTLRSVTLFYELSACDLNIVSKVPNSSLGLDDIFYFSCGVKFQLFNP